MKICPECGGEFKNLGAHMKAHRGKDERKELQKAEATKPQRPLDRWRTNAVQPGCVGVRIINRGT